MNSSIMVSYGGWRACVLDAFSQCFLIFGCRRRWSETCKFLGVALDETMHACFGYIMKRDMPLLGNAIDGRRHTFHRVSPSPTRGKHPLKSTNETTQAILEVNETQRYIKLLVTAANETKYIAPKPKYSTPRLTAAFASRVKHQWRLGRSALARSAMHGARAARYDKTR